MHVCCTIGLHGRKGSSNVTFFAGLINAGNWSFNDEQVGRYRFKLYHVYWSVATGDSPQPALMVYLMVFRISCTPWNLFVVSNFLIKNSSEHENSDQFNQGVWMQCKYAQPDSGKHVFFGKRKHIKTTEKDRLHGGFQQKWLHDGVFLYAPQTWNMKIHWPNFNVQGPHNCFYF